MEQRPRLIHLLPVGRNQWLVYVSCLLVFVGFSCSRAAISTGLIGLIISSLVISDIRQTIKIYASRPAYYINALFFIVILLSGFNSENKAQWLIFLQIKIPFLLLPIAFCGFNFFDKDFFNKILFAFAACMFISALCVMGNYAMHYDAITQHISSGGIIPVPFSHIRYTLLLVFAVFICLWLWEQWQRYFLLAAALIFAIVTHVLSSRSGWLALYAGLLFYFAAYIYRSRKFILGLLMLTAIIAFPFILYRLIPSFHNKIGYMNYTIDRYRAGDIDDMSDAMRLSSWRTGAEIIKRNAFTGTGVGDLMDVSKQVSKELFPNIHNEADRKMPHNEFIWIWAACGLFGLLAYCAAFLYPLILYGRRNWLFIILYIIFLTSFLTEYSLEEQIGSTFYLLFLLIFLTCFNHSAARHDQDNSPYYNA